jgi:hypothetical protein
MSQVTAGVDAIELIQNTAINASKAEVLEVEQDPDHVLRIAKPDGSVERIECDPTPREHEFASLEALIKFTKSAQEGKHTAGDVVVWYDNRNVRVVLDDKTRRDKGRLILVWTPQWLELWEDATAKARGQVDFARFLRINMADTLPDGSKLLQLIREVKFRAGQDGEGKIEQGKESFGKAINAQVLGVEAFPEEVTLDVRVFDVPDLVMRAKIVCALDILVHEQMFRLVPLPMQLSNAIARAIDEIAGRLRAELECPVYRGSV